MANRDRPMGFTPVTKLDGSKIPTWIFPANAVGSNLFVGDCVAITANGDLEPMAAGGGDIFLGVVTALWDENMIPISHPNSTVSTKYLPSADTGFVTVALAVEDALFRSQSSGSIVELDRFRCVDHVATDGDSTTGRSKEEVDSSTSTAAQFKIWDKVAEPNNAWGTNVDLLLLPCESFMFDGTAGV